MELTPRTSEADSAASRPRKRRSPLAYGTLAAVLIGLGVVVYQGLTSASLYFYNADEAVEQRADLGERRFRLQGSVEGGTIDETASGITFTVVYNSVEVDVRHDGSPPELFEPGIPVVLEGRWSATDDAFDSDRILVKHSEEYEAENEDRLDEAEDGTTGSAEPAAAP
ncbi:MAG: cytochrome c maturation protein CcmE [Acidimicrobiales bacterium]